MYINRLKTSVNNFVSINLIQNIVILAFNKRTMGMDDVTTNCFSSHSLGNYSQLITNIENTPINSFSKNFYPKERKYPLNYPFCTKYQGT